MSKKKSILVIDDDDALCNALTSKFTAKGYNVVTCKNGVDAVEHLSSEKFDVVLTDLHMPEGDGFDVLVKLKESMNADIPAYVITNLGSDQFCDKAMHLGAKKCFVKSLVTLRDVVAIVDQEVSS
ncbi:MAG: response regulator [Candidatus Peribacteraceae bacterium]|jgi:two-component system KDP operon response regulator KdpE|nr:response regulator [Candidatus Peribacteraceae bacterium]MDP7476829.1 response regulator [Candidatus Peribacteraceae bacterium]